MIEIIKTSTIVLFAFLGLCFANIHNKDKDSEQTINYQFVEQIPGNLGNYRSKQLSVEQIDSLLATGQIERTVRMNSNSQQDNGGVLIHQEERICQKYDVKFEYINIHRRGAVEHINELLRSGKVWIHCKHGYDRSGAAIGYHLRKLGYPHSSVVEHNRWDKYVQRKGEKYRVYWNMIK